MLPYRYDVTKRSIAILQERLRAPLRRRKAQILLNKMSSPE
jgi:hypothetical protein